MKIDVNKLDSIALDYAVTKVLDPDALEYGVQDWREQRASVVKNGEYIHRYHQSWAQAGPLIRQFRVSLIRKHDGLTMACIYDVDDEPRMMTIHHDPIVAAMRCVVYVQLGCEVDIPEELL